MHRQLCLVVTLLALRLLHLSTCRVYYIIPTSPEGTICPTNNSYSCLIFDKIANSSLYLDSNTTFIFLPGSHSLHVEISVSNISELRMLSHISPACPTTSTVTVSCYSQVKFTIEAVNKVVINGLSFVGCGGITFSKVDQLTLENTTFHGTEYSSIALVLNETSSTNLENDDSPVSICFCFGNQPNCSLQLHTIKVQKGKIFTVSVIALDQVGRPLNTTIITKLQSPTGVLHKGQQSQMIDAHCSDFNLSVTSSEDHEEITVYADSPCEDARPSHKTIDVTFSDCLCPVGFDVNPQRTSICECVCSQSIKDLIHNCNVEEGTFTKTSNSWIDYMNTTSSRGFLFSRICPYDYCHRLTSVSVNLNIPNGADLQCASNRAGKVCGACKETYTLSLGSFLCLQCPSYWPGLLVVIVITAIVSGIGLVAAILALNMTVAIGTINAIIFYANIIYVQHNVFFKFEGTKYPAIFTAWLNLDIRVDVCFYEGMDAYIKTWLRLAFPAYIIFLVILVIILCNYSTKFANFMGKKDPAATLATLILLSYTRLVQSIIEGLGVVELSLPDGSKHYMWLLDANVDYFVGKHAPLFLVTFLIFLIFIVFTLLLLLWPWFVKCRNKRPLRLIWKQKFASFIETYHIPFNANVHYWTGLLLLVRVILYLVTIANQCFVCNPHIQLTATMFTVAGLLMIKGFHSKPMYRKWPVDAMETATYFNIIAFAAFTSYTLESNRNQAAVAIVSVTVMLIMLFGVISYHAFTYTTLGRLVKKMNIRNRLTKKLLLNKSKKTQNKTTNGELTDYFSKRLDLSKYRNSVVDVMGTPTENDYISLQQLPNAAQEQVREQPTFSIIEISSKM